MVGDHGSVIHLVDVIPGQDQDVIRVVVADDVQVLEDRVRGAGVPGGLDHPLLGRPELDELAELPAQEAPPLLDVQDQRVGLVLGQHADAADPGVDAVGERKVDDTELTAEGHRRLGAPRGQVLESGAPAAGQDQGQGVAGQSADEARDWMPAWVLLVWSWAGVSANLLMVTSRPLAAFLASRKGAAGSAGRPWLALGWSARVRVPQSRRRRLMSGPGSAQSRRRTRGPLPVP